jgi:hypothetical protein
MKNGCFTLFLIFYLSILHAQKIEDVRIDRYVDFAGTIGKSQGTVSASYVHNWKLWKKKRWEIGYSARWSSYFGANTAFITAPARLARTNTTPFLIFFAGQRKETQDTLTVERPFTNSMNVAVNFGYNFSNRWSAGFNIDMIGYTFGRKSRAILTSNGHEQTEPAARPASFNLLLTGDHDRGSLNSEFFLRYHTNGRWNIRAIYEFLFVEYKTRSVKQIAPDGTVVDRFRNKVNTFGIALAYQLNTIRNL